MSISQTYGEIKDYEKKQNPEKTLCILMPVRTLTSKETESLEKYINQQPEWFLLRCMTAFLSSLAGHSVLCKASFITPSHTSCPASQRKDKKRRHLQKHMLICRHQFMKFYSRACFPYI